MAASARSATGAVRTRGVSRARIRPPRRSLARMAGGRYWVRRLDELPLVPTADPDDFDWYPVQHHLGLGAFGVNALGGDAGTVLVAEHDELESDQEELYVVVEGSARFLLDGDERAAYAVSF